MVGGGEWRGVNTLPCQPLHTTHLTFSEPRPEAQGCRGVLPPLSIRRGWTGLSPAQRSPPQPPPVKWEQDTPVSQGGGEDPGRRGEGSPGAQNCTEP